MSSTTRTILTYRLTEPLIQGIVQVLNSMPAGQVRGILNELEAQCTQQDQAAAAPVQASVPAPPPSPPAAAPCASLSEEILAAALG